jgi:hypothetical protein
VSGGPADRVTLVRRFRAAYARPRSRWVRDLRDDRVLGPDRTGHPAHRTIRESRLKIRRSHASDTQPASYLLAGATLRYSVDDMDQLPDGDRIRAFDAYRTRILALPDAIAAASGARLEELCRIVIQRVVVADRQLRTIEWVPAARPFFEKQRECPQGALGTRPLSHDDPLAWYVA